MPEWARRATASAALVKWSEAARLASGRVGPHAVQHRSNRSRGIPAPRAVTLVLDVDGNSQVTHGNHL